MMYSIFDKAAYMAMIKDIMEQYDYDDIELLKELSHDWDEAFKEISEAIDHGKKTE